MTDFKFILMGSSKFSVSESVTNVNSQNGNGKPISYKNVTLKVFNESTNNLVFLTAEDTKKSKSVEKAMNTAYENTCKKILTRASKFDSLKNYLDYRSYVFTYDFAVSHPDIVNLIVELTSDKSFNSIKTKVHIIQSTEIKDKNSSLAALYNSSTAKIHRVSNYSDLSEEFLINLAQRQTTIEKPFKYFGKDKKIRIVNETD